MYQPARDLPERSATERDFFTSRSYLQKHYGLSLTEFRSLPYPFNLLMAERELHVQLRMYERHRHLQIVEQENGQVCLSVCETFNADFCLLYIPVMPIYDLWQNGAHIACAELLTAVCAYLHAEAGISYYRDDDSYMHGNYEVLKEWIDDDWGDSAGDNYAREKQDLENAQIQGDLLLAKMMDKTFRQSLGTLIGKFQAVTDYEQACLTLAQDCLKLWQDFPEGNLFRHANFQGYEAEDWDDNYIGMHEYISFIGSVNDCLSDRLRRMVNDDFNERSHYQEPEILTLFNENQNVYTDRLAYEQRAFRLIDDLCTLLYRKP